MEWMGAALVMWAYAYSPKTKERHWTRFLYWGGVVLLFMGAAAEYLER